MLTKRECVGAEGRGFCLPPHKARVFVVCERCPKIEIITGLFVRLGTLYPPGTAEGKCSFTPKKQGMNSKQNALIFTSLLVFFLHVISTLNTCWVRPRHFYLNLESPFWSVSWTVSSAGGNRACIPVHGAHSGRNDLY